MNKILLTLLVLILISKLFIDNSDRLYGIRLYDDVGDWVHIPRYQPWKKNKDPVVGYYYVDLIIDMSPLFYKEGGLKRADIESLPWGPNRFLYVAFGEDKKIVKIHQVNGYGDSRECKRSESFARKKLENEYNIEMERNLDTRYGFQKWMGDSLLTTECVNGTRLDITLQSKEYFTKYKEYLNSKI